ncbi:sigma-70 family RNA polymerase sigma factor [Nonomuraea sp. NPDC049709]|uniref:RNA polymerase sigma factor n=1 Tax=Nonomuraea sp. NPDC049709 TaxID=3154736 RepID=UPI00343F1CDE
MRTSRAVLTFDELVDGELVVLAQSGDVAALGSLLARHRGGMLAVALSVLRDPVESEDAVQDASLTALARIGDVRDPVAVGPWLKMIVRNLCRKRLATTKAIPVGHLPPVADPAADPQEVLEQHAQRDWVWHAVGLLSPPLRTVTLLRYFSSVTRYDEIAAACGIPVGTVRRRLHEARGILSRTLLTMRHSAHDDMAALTAARRRDAEEAVAAGHHGTFGALLRERWWPDVDIAWANGRRTHGIEHLVRVVDDRMSAGTRQRVTGVAASADVVVWETDVFSPPEAGPGCAPYMCWLLSYDAGRVRRVRLIHRAA